MSNMQEIDKKLLPPQRADIIEGRSVVIKPISENEINDRYLGWLNDPVINQFLEIRHSRQTVISTINYINYLRSRPGCEMFGIFTKKELVHIGNISIKQYNPNQQRYVEFGIGIGDLKAQQLGMGGQALILLMDYLFSDSNIIRVEGGSIAENHRSCKTLEFLGLKREGIWRNRSILSSGKITDVYLYGMLRQEWVERRKMFAAILKDNIVRICK